MSNPRPAKIAGQSIWWDRVSTKKLHESKFGLQIRLFRTGTCWNEQAIGGEKRKTPEAGAVGGCMSITWCNFLLLTKDKG